MIVRFGWNALRFQTLQGERWSVLQAVRGLRDGTPGEWWAQIPGTKGRPALTVRIVAMRKSPQSAEAARQAARKHGHPVARNTLGEADDVLILTTLSETQADAAEIPEYYRLRWPIEIACKRIKHVRPIDALRAFDPDLAHPDLLAKLRGAVPVDAIRTYGPDFSPDGLPVRCDVPRRVAYFPNDLAGSADDRAGIWGPGGLGPDLPRVD